MTRTQETESLAGLLAPYAASAERDLERWLIEPGTPEPLAGAMRYCVLGGGKRLRPALVLLAAEAAGAACPEKPDELTRRASVAVEIVHCYSLVHDDLPAMDDDSLRRGQPTAHVKFGEAMAILAGDALLTRAMNVLVETGDSRAAKLVSELARGAGSAGMIAGQVADMNLCPVPSGAKGLTYIHLHKTAALIRAAARMGALCAGAGESDLDAISRFAESLGLAFQLADDLLDVTGEAGRIGKTPGKDARSGKRTHAGEMGLEAARELGRQLTRQATEAVAPLGERGRKLRRLAELLLERTC